MGLGSKKLSVIIAIVAVTVAAFFGVWFYHLYNDYAEKQKLIKETADADSKTHITVTFMSTQSSWSMTIADLIADFEEENEDIDIEYDIISETGFYEDTLNVLYARGELGDIAEMVNPSFFEKENLLYELPDDITYAVKYVSAYDGKKYAVGTACYTSGIIYNKDIFERYGLSEPKNYDEFIEICETLKNEGVTPIVLAGANSWNLSVLLNHYFDNNVLKYNQYWMAEMLSNKASWEDDDVKDMFSDMKELFEKGYIDTLWNNTTDIMLPELMVNGSAAMSYTCSWMVNEVENLDDETNLGWFYLPDSNGQTITDKEVYSYWTITKECSEDEDKLEAAERFLRYFYSEGVYEKTCANITGLSALKRDCDIEYTDMQKEVVDKSTEVDKIFTISLTNSFVPQQFRSYMFELIYPLLEGELDTDELCTSLQERWEEVLEEEENE
ncbi:MAG: extracellular solute-binding protein [Eubacterium sp.]|nr:extracellular solute-binding protein [Eubacterium sp.]